MPSRDEIIASLRELTDKLDSTYSEYKPLLMEIIDGVRYSDLERTPLFDVAFGRLCSITMQCELKQWQESNSGSQIVVCEDSSLVNSLRNVAHTMLAALV